MATLEGGSRDQTTYRIRNIPPVLSQRHFHQALSRALDIEEDHMQVLSLVTDAEWDGSPSKAATVIFKNRPKAFLATKTPSWTIKIVNEENAGGSTSLLTIDTHFHGFTPFSEGAEDPIESV